MKSLQDSDEYQCDYPDRRVPVVGYHPTLHNRKGSLPNLLFSHRSQIHPARSFPSAHRLGRFCTPQSSTDLRFQQLE